MARPFVLSNGELHVGINTFGLVHDFYFPHVGLENHSAGGSMRHKIGVWVENTISWLDDGNWKFRFVSSDAALVGSVRASNSAIGVILEIDSFVDAMQNTLFRTVHIINTRDVTRDIRLFLHQAFAIGDRQSNGDTAQYLPDSNAILHYRGRRVFVAGARSNQQESFDQHSIGLFGIEGKEGTFRDADDGELSGSNVEHGRVDSTLRLRFTIEPHLSARADYWICAGTDIRSALRMHRRNLEDNSVSQRMTETYNWWHRWLEPAIHHSEHIPSRYRSAFFKSLMVIKAHCDKHGAVIASSDSAMLNYSRDNYSYCWPRDGVYALWPLIRLGYADEAQAFFEFCRKAMRPNGYLMHKFLADGSVGSSWHPYVHDEINAPPIQEDETAAVVFMFSQFYQIHQRKELLDEYYDSMIVPMANFLASHIDDSTHLPRPSYELWGEKFLTTTYTTAIVYAALNAAAELADAVNDSERAVTWRTVADDIRQNAGRYLYDDEKKYLIKGFLRHEDDRIEYDATIDSSSLYGAFMYGLFPLSSAEIKNTASAIEEQLAPPTSRAILQRYTDDMYRRPGNDQPPNPWIITSLWRAQYLLEKSQEEDAKTVLDNVLALASSTGMLAEQVHANTLEPTSVQPLVWSHAEFVSTILDLTSTGEPS